MKNVYHSILKNPGIHHKKPPQFSPANGPSDSIHNTGNASLDVNMDSITATTTGPQTQPLPTRPPALAPVDSLPIQFLKSLVDDPAKRHQNGSIGLDNQALAFL
ncbi:hypothetical protein PCANC_28222, partial [Puccinia coronata f. sp. avenae]